MLGRITRVAVAGVTVVLVHDAAGDVVLYSLCKRHALTRTLFLSLRVP